MSIEIINTFYPGGTNVPFYPGVKPISVYKLKNHRIGCIIKQNILPIAATYCRIIFTHVNRFSNKAPKMSGVRYYFVKIMSSYVGNISVNQLKIDY
jgi:hypothetical protein